ncbi:hypothetical protein L198_00090 [Cryptococcus wingfieldii CBS 7118]|uniref:Expansin-like EG45 domain-containing protein n=1 Tax=Cryptococcus wingfieldii CBS 7118 TaxID=1295528 RepID=A0A1E3K5R9_9TREE|nr:hypothetical protein L198_00090 [Cryptococcus wingfieldii CBS 7118]ODO08365.1 hypothetical protein L198_00090 [Cryptococcus wingfieldii CBS 7118]
MFTLFTFLSFVSILSSFAIRPVAGEVLFEMQNVVATVYYDVDWETNGDVCAPRFGAGWAPSQIGTPGCEQNGILQADLGTNRIVAMNQTWMEGDKSAWCGKEVKIFKEDGSELVYDEPLVLWDTCAECADHVKIDLGVGPSLALDDTVCSLQANNPSGLKVQVTDNQIWAPAPDENSYSPTSASTLYTGGVYNFPSSGSLSAPWGATISGDDSNLPVVVKTAGGAQASAAASGAGASSGVTSSAAAAGTGSSALGSSSAAGVTSGAGDSSVAKGATSKANATGAASSETGGASSATATSAAIAETTVAGGSSSLDLGGERFVAGSSSAESTAESASSAGGAQTSASAASSIGAENLASASSGSTAPTAQGATSSAAVASATTTTCAGDDGEDYIAGDHMCDGTTLKICANNESGSSNVDTVS